jgi:predicted Zn-dependent protease
VLGVGALAGVLGAGRPVHAGDDTYIRHVAVEMPGHEFVLLRWHARQMPLRVYLTAPPADLFEDPAAVQEAVRKGIFDWTGVAADGLPRFELVDAIGDADIPVVWAREPDGNWYIAHTAPDIRPATRRFGVSRILVTGRWSDRVADANEIYRVMLHEMGHALGLNGHSPDPGDIMFKSFSGGAEGISERDRATLKALYARPNGARMSGARGARIDY